MEIPIAHGRDFLPRERDAEDVVIVGSDFARRVWGDANPVGKRFLRPGRGQEDSTIVTVVGVVDHRTAGTSESGSKFGVYTPRVFFSDEMLVRTRGPAEAMFALPRSVARAEAPYMALSSLTTLAELRRDEQRMMLRSASAVTVGGFLALLLSAIGLYAVTAFAVAQRSREIGIRTTLGAEPRQILGMFFGAGMRLSAVGLALGLPLSLLALRIFSGTVGFQHPRVPFVGAGVAALVIVVAALASWIPARRAATVDPLRVLRAE
jgi:ABC-type antimicrobial peptide transport system permease subunit